MAATLNLETVDGSLLQQTGLAVRLFRGFTVEDMDATALPDPSLMLLARDMALAGAGAVYPGTTDYHLTGVVIRGITNNGFRGQLIYETFQGLQPSVFIVRDAAYTAERTVKYHPVTGEPFYLNYTNSSGDVVIPQDIASVSLDWPMKALSIVATRFGRPDPALTSSVPAVNDSPWPVENPLPRGFWKCSAVISTENRVQGYYTYNATAITRQTDPWCEMVILRSTIHGKHAKIDPTDFSDMFTSDYSVGYQRGNGFGRVCPYPEVPMEFILPI
jgi:hypothetical protein